MKIHNKRKLQNISINHTADIDYKDFVKIYRECTKDPFLRFRNFKILKFVKTFIKMTVTDQLKIIDNRIKSNQAQYDVDRLAAKISALSSG